jgi:dienelactone hydrolase
MHVRRAHTWVVALAVVGGGAAVAWPYVNALAFISRAADLPGAAASLAEWNAARVVRGDRFDVPTRHGPVPGRLYRPDGHWRRAVTLVPGVHMDGIDESRLVGMADDLARTGYLVLTVAPPNLTEFRITSENTDVIEDGATWLATRPDLAPDGRVGMLGISFSGGLSIVAAARPALRDRVAFVMAFGGHGDLPRVMRYLCSGAAPSGPEVDRAAAFVDGADRLIVKPPHDYGLAVVLLTFVDRLVPAEQVVPLKRGILTFLTASSLTLVDQQRAEREFQVAREAAAALPEPAQALMKHVNDRAVDKLGPLLLPIVDQVARESSVPSLSPERGPAPSAPVFLLHGADDNVIPAVETVLLNAHLRGHTEVHALLSGLITHAEVDRSASLNEVWRLTSFWRRLMSY